MRLRIGLFLLLVALGLGAWSYLRPIPAVAATPSVPTSYAVAGTAPVLPWPTRGSAAVGVQGLGFIATSGNEQPIPAASVTKVMTALLILEDKPLRTNDSGPTITLTDADVQSYEADLADRESVVEVRAGEQITELQALQGMLIPSANNLAETLARWDAGSTGAFVTRMNARAAALHMVHTNFGDTSGASPTSVSTPTDLIALGMTAMKQEVFAQIVGMAQAQLPVAGIVYNVDSVLGQGGIIGIKTGSGLSSGANFLFAATVAVDGHQITLYGCVMGQPTLDNAFGVATSLAASLKSALHVQRVIARNQTVATYVTPWGAQSDLVSSVDVDLVEWPAMVLRQRLDARVITVDKPLPAGTREGTEHMVLGDYDLDVPLVTSDPLYPPGRLWRLTRISF
ncbi:MAG: D-alanyl-D-alanine carboxypeptidase [Candidatus Dormiibacterota bacterium]